MKKPLVRFLAALMSVLTLNLSAMAEAPKTVAGSGMTDLSGAAANQNGTYDNSHQTGTPASAPTSLVGALNNQSAPPSSSAARPVRGLDGNGQWADSSHQVSPDSKPGFLDGFMKSGTPWILGGGLIGGIVGAMVGGPFGFLLGGLMGIIGGYAAHTLIGHFKTSGK